MRKVFNRVATAVCVYLLTFMSFEASAQPGIKAKAMQWVQASAVELGLSKVDRDNLQISDAYTDPVTNITHVYIQQAYHGIKVYNAVNALAFSNGKLLSQTNRFAPKIERFATNPAATLTPEEAVNYAAQKVQAGVPANLVVLQNDLATANRIVFSGAGIAKEKITVEKYWVKRDNSNELDLAWNVNLDMKNSSDWWNLRISAVDGRLLAKDNWVVYDAWPTHANAKKNMKPVDQQTPVSVTAVSETAPPPTATSASYNVLAYPLESALYGTHSIVNSPWLAGGGTNLAATHGWHFDGTTNYLTTRGNNVNAYLDTSSNNNPQTGDTSTTASPSLSFLRMPDFTVTPKTTANRKAAITNLFYWNNIIHDVLYKYGFTEVSGNFQADNIGRGGLGNDFVRAEAQDGSGISNANFGTPVDGMPPRMQMYLWDLSNPLRDGDFDNGIITHEYGHGVSTKLTGGPANSSCLDNEEQGGEGWSDYLGLMLTTNWATAVMADSIKSRPIGNYALNQGTTGVGIRRYPYNTRMGINPLTYANMPGSIAPHGIGEIWCSALWDMTWNIIGQQNLIGGNLYDTANANAGNVIALKLVLAGMKLQPCSPGFLDSRDAILKADSILYNYAHRCAILKAFARRGMGRNARQGSSNNKGDGFANFEVSGNRLFKTADTNRVAQGATVTYTLTAQCGCDVPASNFSIADTLETGLQYVSSSGGATTNGQRVSFNGLNFTTEFQSISKTITARMLTVPCPADTAINDNRDGNTVGGFADATVAATPKWGVSTTYARSPVNSWFAKDSSALTDIRLASAALTVPAGGMLSFWHYYNLELGYDGGVVEISTDAGNTWTDLGNLITQNGYAQAAISGSFSSPISGRRAFTGVSNGTAGNFIQTKIDLSSYAGQSVRIRFRLATDVSDGAVGWYIDDLFMSNPGCGASNIAYLRNASNVILDSSSTVFVQSLVAGPLPVNLLSFNAVKQAKLVQLLWATTNEVGAGSFEIEKSVDGRTWNSIASVAATSSSLTEKKYGADDLEPFMGLNYYRLKMIDRDGSFSYSATRTVKYDKNLIITLQPNPADQSVTISLAEKATGTMTIVDALGKKVFSKNILAAQGLTHHISTADLPNGTYFVNFVGVDGKFSEKLLVQHP